ncbi:MAG: flavodoxin family protein [Candidatus Altiarchaeota archaeon]|nr:flavodoxin family protein [Candidatus Altiarchaeota archaeon]
MKVVGINASHRRESNSGLMLSTALEICSAKGFEVEQIDLWDKEISYCVVCGLCGKKYGCSQDDDVMDILDKLAEADAILVATPTYFGGISGRLKSLFDRTLPLRRNKMMLSGKIGAAFAVGGSRNGGQEYTIQQIHAWMLIHEMAVVGDKKTAHFGGICTARNAGDALKDEVGMQTVINTAENLCARLSSLARG